jgi:uncharacterized protein (UPF0333 family)
MNRKRGEKTMTKIEVSISIGFSILLLAIVAIISQTATIALIDQITMLIAAESVALTAFALCFTSKMGNPQSVE